MMQEPFEVEQEGLLVRGTVYRPAARSRCPAVLMLHGFTGHRIETGFLFVTLGRALAEQGVGAVTFDFRHSGESDGQFEQMLPSGELADVLRVLGWLRAQPFADRSRLALLGFSLGGLLAACAAGRTADLRALVLVAPTTGENLVRHVGPAGADGSRFVGPHRLHAEFLDDLGTLDPLSDVVRQARPTLVVAGSEDTAVPMAVCDRYVRAMQAAGTPLELRIVEGADHAFSAPHTRRALVEQVAGWLRTKLHG